LNSRDAGGPFAAPKVRRRLLCAASSVESDADENKNYDEHDNSGNGFHT